MLTWPITNLYTERIMLSFKNYVDSLGEQNLREALRQRSLSAPFILTCLYLDYIEWLIQKIKSEGAQAQDYTATELLVQLKLIGEFCNPISEETSEHAP